MADPKFEPHGYTDAELVALAEAYAANREQVLNMLPTMRAAVGEYGPVVGWAATAKALRGSEWDRDDLVLFLAAAMVQMEGGEPNAG